MYIDKTRENHRNKSHSNIMLGIMTYDSSVNDVYLGILFIVLGGIIHMPYNHKCTILFMEIAIIVAFICVFSIREPTMTVANMVPTLDLQQLIEERGIETVITDCCSFVST